MAEFCGIERSEAYNDFFPALFAAAHRLRAASANLARPASWMRRIGFIRLVRVESTTGLPCNKCEDRGGLCSMPALHRRCVDGNSPTAKCGPAPESSGLVVSLRLVPARESRLASMLPQASRQDRRTESERERQSRRDADSHGERATDDIRRTRLAIRQT